MKRADCYVDLYEKPGFQGRWWRVFGPAQWSSATQGGSAGKVVPTFRSVRVGCGARVELYSAAAPQRTIGLDGGTELDCVDEGIDSLRCQWQAASAIESTVDRRNRAA
jgi:hypothetical protein